MHIFRGDAGDVGLNDLADFLLKRHLAEQLLHSLFDRRIGGLRLADRGPAVRVRNAGAFTDGRVLTLRAYRHRRQRNTGQKQRVPNAKPQFHHIRPLIYLIVS